MDALIKSARMDEDFVLSAPRVPVNKKATPQVVADEKVDRVQVPLDNRPSRGPSAPQSTVIEREPQPAPTNEPAATRQAVESRSVPDDSHRHADQLEHQARVKVIEEKAASDGFAKGFAKGEKAGADTFSEATEALIKAKAALDHSCGEVLGDAERLIGAIVFEAVCKIVGARLASDEGCRAVVEEVVARARREDIVSLRLAPADVKRLSPPAGDTVVGDVVDRLAGLTIEPDEAVELGGCIVQLKGGNIDGRIETQFRALAQSLKDAARRR